MALWQVDNLREHVKTNGPPKKIELVIVSPLLRYNFIVIWNSHKTVTTYYLLVAFCQDLLILLLFPINIVSDQGL